MIIILDTNILLRLAQLSHPLHATCRAAVAALQARGDELRIFPQNLFEFWAAATRPVLAMNGLGLTTVECHAELNQIRAHFPVLPDAPTLLQEWEALVVAHDCKGKVSHDARIVAAMRTYGISHILTFNGGDFVRYPGLTVVDPADVVKAPGASPSE